MFPYNSKEFLDQCFILRFILSTFYIVQILVHSHFDLVSLLLALEATEPVSEMALELINKHLI